MHSVSHPLDNQASEYCLTVSIYSWQYEKYVA